MKFVYLITKTQFWIRTTVYLSQIVSKKTACKSDWCFWNFNFILLHKFWLGFKIQNQLNLQPIMGEIGRQACLEFTRERPSHTPHFCFLEPSDIPPTKFLSGLGLDSKMISFWNSKPYKSVDNGRNRPVSISKLTACSKLLPEFFLFV